MTMAIQVKIKKLCEQAVIPAYAHDSDAGLDLVATSKEYDKFGNIVYGFGLAVEIPDGYVGLIFPRSSIYKQSIHLTNCVGVIDSGYRGEISAKFKPSLVLETRVNCKKLTPDAYEIGDRIAQMIILPYPRIEFVEAAELSDSDRGEKGYGSTGK